MTRNKITDHYCKGSKWAQSWEEDEDAGVSATMIIAV